MWKNYMQVDFLLRAHEAYMGIPGKVFDEFLGFRSYVSHTLCKNRFFLYMSARNMQAFKEPNVWPVLKAEIESLYELGPTLYGLTCAAVFDEDKDNDKKAIDDAICKIETLKNQTEWTDEIEKHADKIKKVLEDIPDKLDKADDFKMDMAKVKSYTTEPAEALKKKVEDLISKNIVPLIGQSNLDNSEDYWKLYPEMMKLIRICLVQSILEGQDEEFISETKDMMQAVMYPENNSAKLKQYGDSKAA